METGQSNEIGLSPGRIKVLLVGAHRLVAEALGLALGADPELEVVDVRTEAGPAVDRVHETWPDVVLLDGSHTQRAAAELTATLRTALPELQIIVLNGTIDEDTLSAYVRAGAAGYFSNDGSLAELIHSIKQVHMGQVLFAPDQLVNLLTRPHSARLTQPLAPREAEVLQVLATGVSTEEAAAKLGISVHTLRTHVKKAITKLGVRSKLEAILLAIKEGLITVPE